jgi:hypothetical protein
MSYNYGYYSTSYAGSGSYDPQYVTVTDQNVDTLAEETVYDTGQAQSTYTPTSVYVTPQNPDTLSTYDPQYVDITPQNPDTIAKQQTPLAAQSGNQARPSQSGGGGSSGGGQPKQQQPQQQQRPITIQNILPRQPATNSNTQPYGATSPYAQSLMSAATAHPLLMLGGVGLLAYMLGKHK